MTRTHRTARVGPIVVLQALAFLVAGEVRADRIVLRGGGQIKGKVVPDSAHPDRVMILGFKGKTPLNFQKVQVIQVIPESSPLDEYVARRDKAAPTPEAQYELGLWCEQYKLADLAEIHYEAALRYDKSFAAAHAKLGHVLAGSHWLTGDELREAQGLVRYKGKWITKEEKERRDAEAATTAEQTSWVRRIRVLRQTMEFGAEDRRRDAEQQLMEIREPIAVGPLIHVLGDDNASVRSLLDHILGAIPGPQASSALVQRVLFEADPDVRGITIEELARRKEPNVIPSLTRALRSTEPRIVNRAAWALSNLDAVATVPKLIPALFTTQYRVVMVGSGGSSSGGMTASFGSVAPNSGMSGGGTTLPSGSSISVMSPPVVGAGSVGYGASAVPYYSGAGVSTGGGGSGSRVPTPRLVPFTYQNVEVLSALVKLTGCDFGFDVPAWNRWVNTSFRADPTPARTVPQP